MKMQTFYEDHYNFSRRTLSEYFISPGIKCKFDILKKKIGKKVFKNGIDLGSSGNSFLFFLKNLLYRSLLDIAVTPLIQYTKVNKNDKKSNFPLCGDISFLPYRDESFDFVSALDVLEHVKDHFTAIAEINRITKKDGIIVITVPHRMEFYSRQDKLIGHYRRYEIEQILNLFKKNNLTIKEIFGVYGKIMRIADIQAKNPKKIEENLMKLRYKYENNSFFRKIWDIFVHIGAFIMRIDALYSPKNKIMNIAFIFQKK